MPLGEHARPETLGGEEEEKAAHHAEMRGERVDVTEASLAHAPLHDPAYHLGHAKRVGEGVGTQVLGARQHLAQHHGREVRVPTRRRLRDQGDERPQGLWRGAVGGGEGFDLAHDVGEGGRHDRPIESPLAAEVVADQGRVHASARGDRGDPRALVAPLGEERGARRQQGVAGGPRVTGPPPGSRVKRD
jgi:hypothetical protein